VRTDAGISQASVGSRLTEGGCATWWVLSAVGSPVPMSRNCRMPWRSANWCTASIRKRHPEAAGFLGVPVKLDVSVPAAQWVRLASSAAAVVADVDPGARVITFGHVADGNVHVNIVPAAPADGRHEDAVFRFVASLGGSISAEHGIGALKAPWLPLARTEAERALFARIRSALDPSATLNPNVLPR
jgi:FAD/FMN-containing dehydrogenase